MQNEIDNKEMSFIDHLEALRWHLIRSIIAISALTVVAFIFKEFVFDEIILAPNKSSFFTYNFFCELASKYNISTLCIDFHPLKLINIYMSGQFVVHIIMSIIIGVVLSYPYLVFELWLFIKPALKSKEKIYFNGLIISSSFLFFLGVLFGYYLIIPLTLNFFESYSISESVINAINIDSYISTFISVILINGLVFQMPLLVYVLSKAGIVSPSFLKRYRRHAIIIILIIAAIITPPDIFSQIIVSIPIVLLYQISILISHFVKRTNDKV